MSTTADAPTHTISADATARPTVCKQGLSAAAAASIATTGLAALASVAGVSFADPTGAGIPLAGFTQVTFVLAMTGVAIAAVIARTARRPRSTFVKTTVALTAASFIPDVTFGFDAPSAVTLMALHVVAAVIMVPILANRLMENR